MINSFTAWLLKVFVKDYEEIERQSVRSKYGFLEGILSVVINILVAGIKGTIGFLLGSYALIADAIHSMTDCVSSLVIIFCFRASSKSPNEKHPFGYGKMESIASLIVAILLILTGIELVQASMTHFNATSVLQSFPLWVYIAVAATCIGKEFFAQISLNLAVRINSGALKVDFWHHRTDTITTVLVLISMFCSSYFGIVWIDKAAAVGVGIFIIYTGVVITREAITPLLGQSPGSKEIMKIIEISKSHEGVIGVHDIIVHHYGRKHMITLHMEVSGKMSIMEAHDVAERVEVSLVKKFGGVTVVHIDPVLTDHEKYNSVVEVLNQIAAENEKIVNYSDVRVVGSSSQFDVIAVISVMPNLSEKEMKNVVTFTKEKLIKIFPTAKLYINSVLDYSGASSSIREANMKTKFKSVE